MSNLYHGSVVRNLKTLEPRKRYTPSQTIEYAAIYATPLPGFAAAHSFAWSSDEGVELDVENGKVTMLIPETLKERLSIPISIYTLPPDTFELTKEEGTGATWHSTQPVNILQEKKYSSVLEALTENGVELTFK
ncbi:MAG TPA: hypothetical protein VGE63_01610 [Candidatus Paceibacterota bacterium]